jgi:hypothetical protein
VKPLAPVSTENTHAGGCALRLGCSLPLLADCLAAPLSLFLIPGLLAAGALRVQRGHTSISSSYLADNLAHRHGGAVFVGTVGTAGLETKAEDLLKDIQACYTVAGKIRPALLLSGSNVTNNTAEASGGEPSQLCIPHVMCDTCLGRCSSHCCSR